MKNIVILINVLLLVVVMSCNGKDGGNINYKKNYSADKSFVVEVPNDVVIDIRTNNILSFRNEKQYLFITALRVSENSIEQYLDKYKTKKDEFAYNTIASSDTTKFYKLKKGNVLWSAYELYMMKKIGGEKFVVEVSSASIDYENLEKMIKYIYNSLNVVSSNEIQKDNNITLDKIYSNAYYSVKYSSQWRKLDNVDAITDLYVGADDESIGFTIVRFETKESLPKINKEGNENLKQVGYPGLKFLENKQIKLQGLNSYKTIYEFQYNGGKRRELSYQLKKGNMFYCIRFGNVESIENQKLANDIIKSFKLK